MDCVRRIRSSRRRASSSRRHCASIAGAEGRCLSTCLPAVAAACGTLLRACAPPASGVCPASIRRIRSDRTHGACGLACDAPAQPPVALSCPWERPPVYDRTPLPHAVHPAVVPTAFPTEIVGSGWASLLSPCPGGFCAPDPIIAHGWQSRSPELRGVRRDPGRRRCPVDLSAGHRRQPSLEAVHTAEYRTSVHRAPIRSRVSTRRRAAASAATSPPPPRLSSFRGAAAVPLVPLVSVFRVASSAR
jgi:hypothetical protein